MNIIKCTISYDGSNFSGFQIQPDKRTIQGELEKALLKMHKGKTVRIHPSGRTDAGVHAVHQVFHFETELTIPSDAWKRALQTLLPSDILMKQVTDAPAGFHARYNAIEKEYRYYILNRKEPDVFRRNYVYHSAAMYNLDLMQQACHVFEGTHDFTSFASARSEAKGSKVRTLHEVSCSKDGDIIQFTLQGTGFLRYMVRIIIGAILEVGAGKQTAENLSQILEDQSRINAGVTIPPEGLYLWHVTYE